MLCFYDFNSVPNNTSALINIRLLVKWSIATLGNEYPEFETEEKSKNR